MSPTAVSEQFLVDQVYIADLKAKVVDGHVELDVTPPPVADNHMYDFKYNHALPTTDVLGTKIPAEANATIEAQALTDSLARVLSEGDAAGFVDLFLDYGRFFRFFNSDFRCLARQIGFHLGPPNLQLQREHSSSCQGSPSIQQGFHFHTLHSPPRHPATLP